MANPSYNWRPKFTPGPQSCVIKSYVETRARGSTGPIFWRSKDVGAQWNSIKLTGTLGSGDGTGFLNPSPSETDPNSSGWNNLWNNLDTIFEFTVEYPIDGYVHYYYAEQGTYAVNPTPPPDGLCNGNNNGAWQDIRTLVNANDPYIESPSIDTPGGWDAGDLELTVTCSASAFTTTMLSGGSAGPAYPSDPIVRTGPEKAIVHINSTERGQANGNQVEVNQTNEFNGRFWIPYSGN